MQHADIILWASQLVLVVKNPSANAGNIRYMGSIPGQGISPGGGNGNPLQYFCLEHSMDRGACWVIVYQVTKSQIGLKQLSTCPHIAFYTINKLVFISRSSSEKTEAESVYINCSSPILYRQQLQFILFLSQQL